MAALPDGSKKALNRNWFSTEGLAKHMSSQLFSISLPPNWKATYPSKIFVLLNGEGLLTTPVIKKPNVALRHLRYWYKVVSLDPQLKMGRQKYVCPLLCKPWLSMTKKKNLPSVLPPYLYHIPFHYFPFEHLTACRLRGNN